MGIPHHLVKSNDVWIWKERNLERIHRMDTADWLRSRDDAWYSLVSNIRWEGVDVLYSMGGENLRLLHKAKESAVKVVVDAFISPLNLRQTYTAKMANGIAPDLDETNHVAVEAHYKKVFDAADIILCPSRWVAEGVEALDPAFAARIRICPYGSSLSFSASSRNPVAGRVFWAGIDWFRKGLHHLAAAADILKPRYPELDFRIAGITDPEVTSLSVFRNLNFLGKLDRSGMEREFASADMFVFPTLSEGMASVLVEAIASGCPVLTTRSAGFDALEDGKGGHVFEAGNPHALAELIENLYLDRSRLEAMSGECAALAANYTEDAWAGRLKHIVAELAG